MSACIVRGRKSDYKFLIEALAQAKGLPKRVTERAVLGWLNGIIMLSQE
jgi:hypothetical protein